ncbi:MAG: CNP1-like family protein [Polaromonas sp.]
MKPWSASLVACGIVLGLSSAAWAQTTFDEPEWKESDAPPPPAFDVGKLVTFEVSPNSALVYGIDPAAITLSKSDGLVRYVMAASSSSGARNVLYEAIRCSTGEVKTYASYSSPGQWSWLDKPQWRSLYESMPSRHALRFAQAGACDGATPALSVDILVRRLKTPGFRAAE